MRVLKFGGTSVGSPSRMQEVAQIMTSEASQIVVLSAVAGTTNKLVQLADALSREHHAQLQAGFSALRQEYEQFVTALFPDPVYWDRAIAILAASWDTLRTCFSTTWTPAIEKEILAQGELLSTQLFTLYLEGQGVEARLLPALEFMQIDASGEPDLEWIEARLNALLAEHPGVTRFITQGYICRNAAGEIDNLKRGGSDYTATLIGAALRVEEIQIWTDIDGLHVNDPRVVSGTWPVRQVSFREAAELAYFGAKILHPTCVLPAEERGIPLRLKNTFTPDAPGTLISSESSGRTVTAIAAKDNITAIKIRSGRMLNAYGFLRRVFEVFEQYQTPIDMITTSEVSVSLTVDDTGRLPDILTALGQFGDVQCDADQSIICIVGDALHAHTEVTHRIFAALANVPLRMVSYGGSLNNISVLIPTTAKNRALQQLHQQLFVTAEAAVTS